MSMVVKLIIVSLVIFVSKITSSPSGIYFQLSDDFQKPTRFKRFLDFPEPLRDFVHQAATTVQQVPKKIQNFFYPNSENNEEHTHHDQILRSTKESGQWNFFGREWLKYIGDSIGNKFGRSTTTGLDTNKRYVTGNSRFQFIKEVKAIVPGTHFCGQGDIAGENRQLGYFSDTDACCKQHDGCAEDILPGNVLYGLENTGLFTRSHCDCDQKFYNCLKNVGGVLASKIGFTFFTVLGPQCFKIEYPITKCSKTSWRRCVKYEFDRSQEKRAQWFDNPIY